VTRVLTEGSGLDEALPGVLRTICQLAGWDMGTFWGVDPQVQHLRCLAIWHDAEANLAEFESLTRDSTFAPGTGLPGRVWARQQPAWVRDVCAEAHFVRRAAAFRAGLHTALAFPVLCQDVIIGVIELFHRQARDLDSGLLTMLTTLGRQIGGFTERKRGEEKLHAYTDQLQSLSRRLLEVQESERRYLARELHDEIGQYLTGLNLTLQNGARLQGANLRDCLDKAQGLIRDFTARVRDLSLRLRPTMLDDLGLVPALVWHFERYTEQTGIEVVFEHRGLTERFPAEVETAAYRIVQEALTNVARHADVRLARVRLWMDRDTLHLRIDDQGNGFDPRGAPGRGPSSGLSGMKERAVLLGGTLTIDSSPGAGTRLAVELPAYCTGLEKTQ